MNRLMVGYDQGSNQNGVFNFSGTFTGDSFADYLLGIPLTATGGLGSAGNFGGVAKYSIGTQYDAYIQDDWKVTIASLSISGCATKSSSSGADVSLTTILRAGVNCSQAVRIIMFRARA